MHDPSAGLISDLTIGVVWAAGVLLVREAGGRVTGYGGAPFDLDAGHLVATNGLVHDALVALVTGP